MSAIRILRAGPLTTLQDEGRFGQLRHGISASGPMDRGAYHAAGAFGAAALAIEFTQAGLTFEIDTNVRAGFAGGGFTLTLNGGLQDWPATLSLRAGDRIDVTPGPAGNYGYVRFNRDILVPPVLGSLSTNSVVGLGGLEGRALRAGDILPIGDEVADVPPLRTSAADLSDGPIRFVWGLHADLFDNVVRAGFTEAAFAISSSLDRMGVKLRDAEGVFAQSKILALVSDAIVPGDIQILGDGTPIVLMRDHQPTGGYPRVATIISADLDRFAQLRPGTSVRFQPVTPARAYGLLRT